MGTATRVFIRAVTAAGKGDCAVAETVGNPPLNGKDMASASSAGETSPVEGRTAQLTLWGEQR